MPEFDANEDPLRLPDAARDEPADAPAESGSRAFRRTPGRRRRVACVRIRSRRRGVRTLRSAHRGMALGGHIRNPLLAAPRGRVWSRFHGRSPGSAR